MAVFANKPAISYAKTFYEAVDRLPNRVLADVTTFTMRFLQDPTASGLNYEKIAAADPSFRSVRVNGSYRAIVRIPDDSAPNTYFLLWVDKHDDAYEWAKRKRILRDEYTNAVSLVEMIETTEETSRDTVEPMADNLFQSYTDEELLELSVDNSVLFLIRAVKTRDQFESIKRYLSALVSENLEYLLSEIPYSEVLESYLEQKNNRREEITLEEALTESINGERFFVARSEEDEELLHQFLHGEIDVWRIFLHPKQRSYVEGSYPGPVEVMGGPGTGKSVVAMHRAKYLLEHLYPSIQDRILFSTFSSNLSEDLEELMKSMVSPQKFSRLEVMNLDKVVSRLLREYFPGEQLVYGEDVLAIWTNAIEQMEMKTKYLEGFLKSEYEEIIIEGNIGCLNDYFAYPRVGQGVSLNRKQKKEVWVLVENYKKLSSENKKIDAPSAERKLATYLKENVPHGLYRCIIADEVQDLRNSSLDLLRVLAGEEKKNDIFLVGDIYQRIFRKSDNKSKRSIETQGRVYKLIHNYRTTEEIYQLAQSVVAKIGEPLGDELLNSKGYCHSQGEKPTISRFATKDEELENLMDTVKKWIARGIPERNICILTRSKNEISMVKEVLSHRDCRTFEIKPSKRDDKTMPGVRLSTMHRAKGLEFDCVAIFGMEEANMPHQRTINSSSNIIEKRLLERNERFLLYVAITRAKNELAISYTGTISPFLISYN